MHTSPVDAVKKLFEIYSPMLFGLICRKITERKLAEKILKETFKKAYHDFKSVNGSITIWIFQISREICQVLTKNLTEIENVYTGESTHEKVIRLVVCEGESLPIVASELNMNTEELKIILREALQDYKMQPI
ncbi:MAG: hypothetical protein ACKVPJ_03055 [Chitinophagales bacterium]